MEISARLRYHSWPLATPKPTHECGVFWKAKALDAWRQAWLAYAAARPSRVLVLDYDDFYAAGARRRCDVLLRACEHFGLHLHTKTKRSLRAEACSVEMARARVSGAGEGAKKKTKKGSSRREASAAATAPRARG